MRRGVGVCTKRWSRPSVPKRIPNIQSTTGKIFVFDMRTDSHTIQVQHGTTRPLPGVTLKQLREEWCLPISAAARSVSRRLHQGRGERDSARDGQHSRPSSFPHERHRELHVRRCVSCSGVCQHLQNLHGLLAPPTTGLYREHDELAPS